MVEKLQEKKFVVYWCGFFVEYVVVLFLLFKGYYIVVMCYCSKGGEVDIVVCKGDLVVFVEVKVWCCFDEVIFVVGYIV